MNFKLWLGRRVAMPFAAVSASGALVLNMAGDAGRMEEAQVAAASCSLTVPSKVAISAQHTVPVVTIGADCAAAGVTEARWNAKRADGVLVHEYVSRFSRSDVPWHVFDTESLAPRSWQPAGATAGVDVAAAREPSSSPRSAAVAVPQNTPATDVRMASKLDYEWIQSDACRLHVWAQRYAITPHGFINYGGVSGSIQQLNATTGGWFVRANFTTDSTGRWAGRVNLGTIGSQTSIRAVIYDAQYIFGSISPVYSGEVGDCTGVAIAPSEQLAR